MWLLHSTEIVLCILQTVLQTLLISYNTISSKPQKSQTHFTMPSGDDARLHHQARGVDAEISTALGHTVNAVYCHIVITALHYVH